MDDRRFDQIMRQSDARWAESKRQSDARWAVSKRQSDEFSERLIRRMESSEQHFIDALAENTNEIRRLGEIHDARQRSMLGSMQDMRESIQANTRAVLSVLDRLDGLEGGTA